MKKNRGFTLFETMIAIAILSGAILVVAKTWSSNSQRVKKWRINQRASILLESKMAEIDRLYANRFDRIPEDENGTFEGEKRFTWTMKSQEFEMPDISSMLKQGDQGADEILLTLVDKLGEYFNDSIKEVTVTINYKEGKQNLKFSATTFFVDYNKQIPLPNLGGGLPGAAPTGKPNGP